VPGHADAGHGETHKVGPSVVDLLDTNTKQLLRGVSSTDTLCSNANKNIKELEIRAEKMFKQIPPDSSKKQWPFVLRRPSISLAAG
jgi:hypothetical protein